MFPSMRTNGGESILLHHVSHDPLNFEPLLDALRPGGDADGGVVVHVSQEPLNFQPLLDAIRQGKGPAYCWGHFGEEWLQAWGRYERFTWTFSAAWLLSLL